jgi:hypothetical protein
MTESLAATLTARIPLRPDPALWAAFAEEREAHPYRTRKTRHDKPEYTHCRACRKEFRPKSVTVDRAPGTVQHRSKGLCRGCSRRHT